MKKLIIALAIFALSCGQSKRKEISDIEVVKLDLSTIENLKHASDSVYAIDKHGKYITEVYVNTAENVVTHVGRDTLGGVYFVDKEKNGVGFFVSEYYSNGQSKGKLQFEKGKINGEVKYYYEDGRVSAAGQYDKGNRIGEWLTYDESGKLIKIQEYENNKLLKEILVK